MASKQVKDPSQKQINTLIELHASGRLAQAEQACKDLLQTWPQSQILLDILGVSLMGQSKREEAVRSFDKAIQLNPDYARAYCNRGNALLGLGQLEQAVSSYDRAIKLQPNFVAAYSNRGIALQGLGLLEQAVNSYDQAIQLNPEFVAAYNSRGNALQGLGQLEQAVKSYNQVIRLNPDFSEAYSNRGVAQQSLGQLEQAALSFDQAIRLKPDFAAAYNNLGNVQKDLGRLEQAMINYDKALQLDPDSAEICSNWLFTDNYIASHSPTHNLVAAQKFGALIAARKKIIFHQYLCPPNPKKLRIGFVSGDLHSHPVGYFLEGILANFDSDRVELIAYPTAHESDSLTQRIKPFFSAWRDLFGQSDEMAAKLIHGDGIHVLIDLAGHTAKNRLPVFGWKPAPIQVSWLGYFATTGLDEMDYLIGDPHVTPPEEKSHYTEIVWPLPETYFCFMPPEMPLQVNTLPAVSAGIITFGCFNSLAKMSDSVVSIWARILTAIPSSRLFLKTKQLNDPAVREAVCQRFAQAGVTRNQLLLEGESPRAELLAAYCQVDIALDPYPYPGGTTSLEALWMGVPVLTKRGDRFLSHVGETIAHNAGLSHWIAADEEEYVKKAISFASNIDTLMSLRTRLRPQVLASPLFDAHSFAKNFEDSLWGMWRCWLETREGTH